MNTIRAPKIKVNTRRISQARALLLAVYEEYHDDLSPRYEAALSDVRSLLADIEDDLKERTI